MRPTADTLFGDCSVEVVLSGRHSSRLTSSSPNHKKSSRHGGALSRQRSHSAIESPIRRAAPLTALPPDPASPSPKKVTSSQRHEGRSSLPNTTDDDIPRLGGSIRRSGSHGAPPVGSKRPRCSSPTDGSVIQNETTSPPTHSGSCSASSSSEYSLGREEEGGDDDDYNRSDAFEDESVSSYNITSDDDCPTPTYQPVEDRLSLMTEQDLDRLAKRAGTITRHRQSCASQPRSTASES